MTVGAALVVSGCAGAGGGGGGGRRRRQVDRRPHGRQPADGGHQKLTADSFTKETGIKVNFTILPENELRDKVTQEVATGAGQYDLATIGAYEARSGRERLAHDFTGVRGQGLRPSTRPTSSSRSPTR
jgi:sorbitol/mannitol transport system substrate-binding protein